MSALFRTNGIRGKSRVKESKLNDSKDTPIECRSLSLEDLQNIVELIRLSE